MLYIIGISWILVGQFLLFFFIQLQKKDAYLENEFILCHCQYVKNIC